MRETDRAREAYVQQFYGVDARDAALYHLVIDSTALALDACVELIALAAAARSDRGADARRRGAGGPRRGARAGLRRQRRRALTPVSAARASTRATRPAAPRPPALCGALRARVTGPRRRPDRRTSSAAWCAAARSPACCGATTTRAPARVLYGLRTDGRVAARPTVTGAQAVDWEDIAAGPAPNGRPLLYVGDIGDNASRRAVDRRLPRRRAAGRRRAPPPPPRACGCATPTAPTTPRRCSSIPLRGDLVIVTKVLGAARAYRASARLPAGSQTTLRRGPAIALSLVTAGDVSADGRIVVLRGYDRSPCGSAAAASA